MKPSNDPSLQQSAQNGLSVPDLERVYESLANAIDEVGEADTARFLVKLALLNANAMADPDRFEAHILSAKADL